MSFNKATYTTLLLLILLAVFYFINANALPQQQAAETISADYFPKLLAVALIILCVISIMQTLKKKDKKIPVLNLKMMLMTLLITVVYLFSWNIFGYFYISSFVYLFILLQYYKNSVRYIWIHLLIAVAITMFIYVMFEKLLYIQF